MLELSAMMEHEVHQCFICYNECEKDPSSSVKELSHENRKTLPTGMQYCESINCPIYQAIQKFCLDKAIIGQLKLSCMIMVHENSIVSQKEESPSIDSKLLDELNLINAGLKSENTELDDQNRKLLGELKQKEKSLVDFKNEVNRYKGESTLWGHSEQFEIDLIDRFLEDVSLENYEGFKGLLCTFIKLYKLESMSNGKSSAIQASKHKIVQKSSKY